MCRSFRLLTAYVFKAIELTSKALPQDIPLIGFAGAPFTLASYMIEGGGSKNFEKTKAFMYRETDAWNALMERIVDITVQYLHRQVESGADALQLFDSWVGCLSPADYQRFVQPHSTSLIEKISGSVPVIHFGTNTATLLSSISEAGGEVIGLDWRISLTDGWRAVGEEKAVQGNLDPTILLGTKEEIKTQATRILKEAGGKPGHIFNLGHGILPMTPVDNVKYLVDVVQSYGAGK
jgi:uroporphyrinogen decarboxylase